ncbi:MAG: hypothetical protein WB502_15995 [Thermoactinomyces sp.]
MNAFLVLAIYLLLIAGIPFFLKRENTQEDYLAGNREFGTVNMALSIASTWIWAPALFVSAEQAYINGWVGLFWFVLPNVLCLILFIPFAKRIRKKLPFGFTLSEYMAQQYSPRVKKVYLFQLSSLSLLSTVVLAGGKILSMLTGFPFWSMTLLLGLFTLSYSVLHGIRASVITDAVQMLLILAACLWLVPWTVQEVGVSALFQGLGGIHGEIRHLFDRNGLEVFLAFGFSTTIGLLSGPFGDQSFWQRAFAVKSDKIASSFLWGAIFFAVVPLSMGILGFLAAGTGFHPSDKQMVNLELVLQVLPNWVTALFLFMLLSGLMSTISSNLCSISALTHDLLQSAKLKHYRIGMLVMIGLAMALAHIPGLTLVHLFLFYGTLRASTFATTVLSLTGFSLTEKGVFYGVFSSLLVGWPIFAYGNLMNDSLFKVIGSLTTLTLSGIVAIVLTEGGKFRARKKTGNLP